MILVVGSTGRVGGMVTRRLLDRGLEVRILVRPGSDFQALVDAGAQPVTGDLKDPGSLADACHGVDVVVTTASAGERGGEDTIETVDLQGNLNLIDAARDAGVGQFIFISAFTADENSPVPIARAKAQTEKYLKESGLRYTILAANGILDVNLPLILGWPLRAGMPVTLVGEGRRRHSFIAAADVAAFAAAAVGHPAALDRRIAIGGPEPVCWRDMVSAWERAAGHAVPVRWIAPGELLPDLPPVPGLSELVSGLLAAQETFDSPIEMHETARVFGVRPTSLDEFVRSAVDRNA